MGGRGKMHGYWLAALSARCIGIPQRERDGDDGPSLWVPSRLRGHDKMESLHI